MPEIILTLGPASENPALREWMTRVATRLRLNASHLSAERLGAALESLEGLFRETGRTLPVVVDLQGAKVRIGAYPAGATPPARVELRLAERSEDAAVIPVPHESVFAKTEVGDVLHLNDRRVVLRVEEKPAADRLVARCLTPGPLGPAKGLSCPGRVFELARLTPQDEAAIEASNRFPFVEYAVSFVLDGREAALFRPMTGRRRLVAKLERPAALAALATVDREFDELWLCRGDLGAEASLKELGPLQADFVRAFPTLRCPRMLAGEVLGSMVRSPMPSRSELVHLWDSLQAGFHGFVLSDETAVGEHVADVLSFLEDFFLR